MPTAHLLASDYQAADGTDYSYVDELYHVTDITGWNSENPHTVLDAVPRAMEEFHANILGAMVVSKKIVKHISPTDALVMVQFRNRHSAVYRSRSRSFTGYTSRVSIPNWAPTTTTGGRIIWKRQDFSMPREHIRLTETRYLRNGSFNDDIRATIFNLVGTVVMFPDDINGIPFLLKSPSITDYAPGMTRLIYTFDTSCRILERIVNPDGHGRPLPRLNYLEEWFAPDAGTGTPQDISVLRWQDHYQRTFHITLPFLTG